MNDTLIAAINGYCTAHPWALETLRAIGMGGAAPILFVAGLVGGFTHCAGMCGPFVLAQVTAAGDAPRARLDEGSRFARALLAPYHLGRFTTYVALGAAAGGASGLAAWASGYAWLPALLLAAAALVFLLQGIESALRLAGVGRSHAAPRFAEPLIRAARPLLADPSGWRGYALGALLGFLPCGLLWGALVAAAGSGGAVRGALGMAAFVAGTVPSLVAVGHVGVFFGRRAPRLMRGVGIPLMFSNAGVLGFLAVRALG